MSVMSGTLFFHLWDNVRLNAFYQGSNIQWKSWMLCFFEWIIDDDFTFLLIALRISSFNSWNYSLQSAFSFSCEKMFFVRGRCLRRRKIVLGVVLGLGKSLPDEEIADVGETTSTYCTLLRKKICRMEL